MIAGRAVDLRPLEQGDADLLYELSNDPAVAMSVIGWSPPRSLDELAAHLPKSLSDPSTRRLVVVERSSGERVGLTGLWDLDFRERKAETGLRLVRGAWGRRLGTDAVMTLMAWAFHEVGLRRLEGSMFDFNSGSMALYVDRCGWVIEGRERQSAFRGGRWCDRYLVAILRDEFLALPDADVHIRLLGGADPTPAPGRPVGS